MSLKIKRLVIVSNRLPVTVEKHKGKYVFKESVGGLVSGISSYLDYLKKSQLESWEYIWIGWPGVSVEEKSRAEVEENLKKINSYPVFVQENLMNKFYNGFCNKTIWPLFHYFTSYTVFNGDYWETYKKVNEIFCESLSNIIKEGDLVWIHDYHLMLLPRLLRERFPEIPIGFFLHIPFPSFEVFRLLPPSWAKEIINGLLGADLIGFHTMNYELYFLRSTLRIIGLEHDMGKFFFNGRIVKVGNFPIGIDFQRYAGAVENNTAVKEEMHALREFLGDVKVILSVDRLDYSKGIANRLRGYEIFLEKNPSWREKVVLVLVVVPSRVGVEHYRSMKSQIDELVGKINGRFGNINWIPVIYQYRYLPFEKLVALYAISDVALVTPLRDGMNLVAKEYLASRNDETGVLILSDMAGASDELREALIINPSYEEEIAEAIREALEMPKDEQIRRNKLMREKIKKYNVVRWAEDFIKELIKVKEEEKKLSIKVVSDDIIKDMVEKFSGAEERIIFLDYDGTLVPFAPKPSLARPDEQLIKILSKLSESSHVVIMSGRDKDTLESWFHSIPVSLVAEHGAWIKDLTDSYENMKNKKDETTRGKGVWRLIRRLTSDWKPHIKEILQKYVDRVPGSFIEEKDFSLAWHYRMAETEIGIQYARDLIDQLMAFTANFDLQVLRGNKVVEVRNTGVNKGVAGLSFLSKKKYDFIFFAGDDWTDEDLFKVLPDNSISIKVGITPSFARYNVKSYEDVRKIISKFADIS